MKKIYLVILIATFFLGCNQNAQKKETAKEAKVEKEAPVSEALLVVNYELENMSLEDHAKLGAEVAPNFTSENIDGLIGKTFIGNVDKGVFGGVYYFSSNEAMDAYLESELWKGIVAHPNLVNFKTDTYGTADISEISNGVASKRTTSNQESDAANLNVLVVNYELENMSLEDHAKLGAEVAPNFTSENINGLIGKTFIGNVDKGVFGGVYYFSSNDAVDAYLESELWKGIVAHPNLVNFKTDTYGVAGISSISNGIPKL